MRKIGLDVDDILQPHRDADQTLRDAGRLALPMLCAELDELPLQAPEFAAPLRM